MASKLRVTTIDGASLGYSIDADTTYLSALDMMRMEAEWIDLCGFIQEEKELAKAKEDAAAAAHAAALAAAAAGSDSGSPGQARSRAKGAAARPAPPKGLPPTGGRMQRSKLGTHSTDDGTISPLLDLEADGDLNSIQDCESPTSSKAAPQQVRLGPTPTTARRLSGSRRSSGQHTTVTHATALPSGASKVGTETTYIRPALGENFTSESTLPISDLIDKNFCGVTLNRDVFAPFVLAQAASNSAQATSSGTLSGSKNDSIGLLDVLRLLLPKMGRWDLDRWFATHVPEDELLLLKGSLGAGPGTRFSPVERSTKGKSFEQIVGLAGRLSLEALSSCDYIIGNILFTYDMFATTAIRCGESDPRRFRLPFFECLRTMFPRVPEVLMVCYEAVSPTPQLVAPLRVLFIDENPAVFEAPIEPNQSQGGPSEGTGPQKTAASPRSKARGQRQGQEDKGQTAPAESQVPVDDLPRHPAEKQALLLSDYKALCFANRKYLEIAPHMPLTYALFVAIDMYSNAGQFTGRLSMLNVARFLFPNIVPAVMTRYLDALDISENGSANPKLSVAAVTRRNPFQQLNEQLKRCPSAKVGPLPSLTELKTSAVPSTAPASPVTRDVMQLDMTAVDAASSLSGNYGAAPPPGAKVSANKKPHGKEEAPTLAGEKKWLRLISKPSVEGDPDVIEYMLTDLAFPADEDDDDAGAARRVKKKRLLPKLGAFPLSKLPPLGPQYEELDKRPISVTPDGEKKNVTQRRTIATKIRHQEVEAYLHRLKQQQQHRQEEREAERRHREELGDSDDDEPSSGFVFAASVEVKAPRRDEGRLPFERLVPKNANEPKDTRFVTKGEGWTSLDSTHERTGPVRDQGRGARDPPKTARPTPKKPQTKVSASPFATATIKALPKVDAPPPPRRKKPIERNPIAMYSQNVPHIQRRAPAILSGGLPVSTPHSARPTRSTSKTAHPISGTTPSDAEGMATSSRTPKAASPSVM